MTRSRSSAVGANLSALNSLCCSSDFEVHTPICYERQVRNGDAKKNDNLFVLLTENKSAQFSHRLPVIYGRSHVGIG